MLISSSLINKTWDTLKPSIKIVSRLDLTSTSTPNPSPARTGRSCSCNHIWASWRLGLYFSERIHFHPPPPLGTCMSLPPLNWRVWAPGTMTQMKSPHMLAFLEPIFRPCRWQRREARSGHWKTAGDLRNHSVPYFNHVQYDGQEKIAYTVQIYLRLL